MSPAERENLTLEYTNGIETPDRPLGAPENTNVDGGDDDNNEKKDDNNKNNEGI
jgi:hypothetical protein